MHLKCPLESERLLSVDLFFPSLVLFSLQESVDIVVFQIFFFFFWLSPHCSVSLLSSKKQKKSVLGVYIYMKELPFCIILNTKAMNAAFSSCHQNYKKKKTRYKIDQ